MKNLFPLTNKGHRVLWSTLIFTQSKFLLNPKGILPNKREKFLSLKLQYFTKMFQNLHLGVGSSTNSSGIDMLVFHNSITANICAKVDMNQA